MFYNSHQQGRKGKMKKNTAQMRHSCAISGRKQTRVLIRHHSPVTSVTNDTSDTNDTNDTNLIEDTLVVSPGRLVSQKCSDTPRGCQAPPQNSCLPLQISKGSAILSLCPLFG